MINVRENNLPFTSVHEHIHLFNYILVIMKPLEDGVIGVIGWFVKAISLP